jgi:hypothetical protein
MKIVEKGSHRPRRPTSAEVAAARGKTVPDLIAPGLRVLFCGINPSLCSAAVGHHFARHGNRFWPALQAGGFTGRVLLPSEGSELLAFGYGIVNTPPRLKSCGFWANPPSGEFSAQGPVPTLERPEGRSWFSLFVLVDVFRGSLPPSTCNTKFPKSRTGGTSNGLVGALGAKPAIVAPG